jgi:signal transduction histidine kinase
VRFLNNLKDQKRLGLGNVEILLEPVNLTQLLQTVANNFREKLHIRKMTLEFREPKEPLTALADPQVVKRVLTNLVHNAIKYSPPQTAIKVCAEKINGQIRIEIQDQGVGMEKRHWKNIFEPYWQINSESPGCGLGLYISQQFIRMSGGELGIVDSQPGGGTKFYFTLPAGNIDTKES